MSSKILNLFKNTAQNPRRQSKKIDTSLCNLEIESGSENQDQFSLCETGAGLDAQLLWQCSTRAARAYLDFAEAQKLNALPLGIIKVYGNPVLTFAVPQSSGREVEAVLRFATSMQVRLIPVETHILADAIFRAYAGDDAQLVRALEHVSADEMHRAPPRLEAGVDFRTTSGEIAKFLAALVDYGIARTASDLHLVPRIDGTWVRMRINGTLNQHDKPVCNLSSHAQLINRIKVLAKLDIASRNQPLDGSFSVPLPDRPVSVRVSLMPTLHGDKAVLRLLDGAQTPNLSDLILDSRVLDWLNQFIQARSGSLILAGPTGSGKTTSLYSVLKAFERENLSLVTLEDPIESHLTGVSQTAIDDNQGLSYAACLRAVLRQDPDVLMLGEIRDEVSAGMAFRAALSGHVLLSTVHARDVREVLLRLRNFGIDFLTLAQGVSLVIYQRLIPILCEKCKVIDLIATREHGFEVFKLVGCSRCDYTGYSGRTLACEGLRVDDQVRDIICQGKIDRASLHEVINENNFISLRASLESLFRQGKILPPVC